MASGDTLLVLYPESGTPPDTNPATFDTRAGDSNHIVSVLDYDAATDESMDFNCFMPRSYDGGGLTCTIHWMATTATSGEVVWNILLKSMTDDSDDIDAKAYHTANAVEATAASATGEEDHAAVTFTDGIDMNSIAAGEGFYLRLTRAATNIGDDMAGDAEFVRMEIRETPA